MKIRAFMVGVLACVNLSVEAASFSSSELKNFNITLIDLNPQDAFAPEITFVNDAAAAFGSSINGMAAVVDSSYQFVYVDSYLQRAATAEPFSSLSAAVGNGTVAASSVIARGGSDTGPHELKVEGHAGDPGEGQIAYYSAYAVHPGSYTGFYGFKLSPFTQAIFSAEATVKAATTVGYDVDTGLIENAYGSFSFYAGELESDAPRVTSSDIFSVNAGHVELEVPQYDAQGHIIGHQTIYQPESKTFSRVASVNFSNATNDLMLGELSIHIGVSGGSSRGVVPEPEAPALILAGLLCCAGILRRKKNSPHPCV